MKSCPCIDLFPNETCCIPFYLFLDDYFTLHSATNMQQAIKTFDTR